MESEFLSCPICFIQFNQGEHLPRMISLCGHTLCTNCITNLINSQSEIRCPLDKKKLPNQAKSLEAFPVNFIINQLLEGKVGKGMCLSHHEEPRFVCLSDKSRICDHCIWEGNHEGHEIKSMKAIQSKADEKRKEIESLIENLDACQKEIDDTIERKRTFFLKIIKDTVSRIRDSLNFKELELMADVNYFFDVDKNRLKNMIGKGSTLRNTMASSITNLSHLFRNDDFLNNDNFFNEIQDQITDYTSKININIIENKIQEIRFWFEKVSKTFEDTLCNQLEPYSQLIIPSFDNLKALIREFSEQNATNFQWKPKNEASSLKLHSRFSFKVDGECLEVSNHSLELEESIINLDAWEQIKQIKFQLNSFVTAKEDLQTFSFIWKQLKEPSYISAKFSPGAVSTEILEVLIKGPNTFNGIELDFSGYYLVNQSIVPLFVEKILTSNSKLTSLSLILDNSTLDQHFFATLHRNRPIKTQTLEYFKLSLGNTNITDEDLHHTLIPLPNAKKLFLCFKNTNVNDETLKVIANNTLSSLQSLEELGINLSNSKITDKGISYLFDNLKNITKFELDLSMTDISDVTLESLSQMLASTMLSVKEFELAVAGTQISDKGIQHIFINLPSVKKLSLNLENTNITNQSVEPFIREKLQSFNSLEELKINLVKTGVDNQLQKEIEDLIKNLSLKV